MIADLVDVYRSKGLDAVKAQLEKELTKKDYWQQYLEDKKVDYGYYESKKFLILAQKGAKELSLFKIDKSDYDLVLKDNVIFGEKEGDKQLEGDLKTPEGVYDLTKKLTKLDQFYGPLALVTSYPNTFDKTLNKKGHGIWIHGMPFDKNREGYTKGCIALDNPRLKELDKNIEYNKSILLISNDNFKKASKDEISIILSSIFKWREAWKNSDIDEYLKFYSKSFKRYDGMTINQFKKYKSTIFSRKEKKKIEFSDINISPYPNSLNKQMFKVEMHEKYKTKYYSFIGKKELFLEIKNNKIKILAEG
ncbi:MAG: L,D-transpeptidase family protein [Arcobacter sp.]|nr:L,D-transpeptidase family protein [Arcobacter sp.]